MRKKGVRPNVELCIVDVSGRSEDAGRADEEGWDATPHAEPTMLGKL